MNKEGCPFCRGKNTARFDGDTHTGLTLEWTENETYIVAFGFNSSGKETEVKLPIEYCPICARKLKGGATDTNVGHKTEKVCTGKRCPMQVGYDVKKCKYKECIYRTETEIELSDTFKTMVQGFLI